MALTMTIFQGSVVLSICFSVFRFFVFSFRQWQARARGQKSMLRWPWKPFFKRQWHARISTSAFWAVSLPERKLCLHFYCTWSACYWLLAQDRLIKRVKALGKLTVNSAVLTTDNYLTLDKIPILNLLQTPHFTMQNRGEERKKWLCTIFHCFP